MQVFGPFLLGTSMGYFLAGLCIALWALIPVVAKLGQSSLDSHQFLFYSSLISWLSLIAVCGATGRFGQFRLLTARNVGQAVALGLMGTYFYYLFLYQGYAIGRGVEVLIVQYTWPVMISLLSPWLLGESFGRNKQIGLGLACLAIGLIVTRGQWQGIQVNQPVALIWVAVGSLCFAVFSIFSKRLRVDPVVLTTLYFGAALVASAMSVALFSHLVWPSWSESAPLIINGVLVNGVSYLFWIGALRRLEATQVAPLVFLTPILSAAYLWFGFDEPFLGVYWIALGLIVAAGLVNSTRPARF